ncbi:hypothetical protein [Solicola gregarius]|uniref:Uncharacterized protein n=1 Tax=Solicola gregarius TaxID=2908642 RepID=A0AA46TJX6_9ACTN|nr:hypothetical protein [Solicola gregarius]UYM06697.1 hypothetical protein L0C25_06400 [Solicola gregarius]
MTAMRVQRLTVAAAVLAGGAFIAGPANATGATDGQGSSDTVSAKSSTATAKSASKASARKKVKCALGLQFKPRVGKGHKWIRSTAKTKCNRKVPKIWTSVRLVQTKASDAYKKTSEKRANHNKSTVRTFCPREYREYKVIGKTTVKLPKGSAKKFLRITKSGTQKGRCQVS